jgi:hypothetical protein
MYSSLFRAGFEVLTSVVMKSSIFSDITPYNTIKVNQRFEETYRLHLQGRRVSQALSQRIELFSSRLMKTYSRKLRSE